MNIALRRRNRGRRKHGGINREYLGSFQLSQYPRFRSDYSTFSESSSSTYYPSSDSQLIKLSTTHIEPLVQVPIVDWNLCEGCGICAQNCPVGAIRIITQKAHINPIICTKCGICAKLCPRNAIKFSRDKIKVSTVRSS
jgi:ferredoxin